MRDVVVVGDVHGDGDRLLFVLAALGLIAAEAPNARWTGGTASLVLVGDVLDGAPRGAPPFTSSLTDLDVVDLLHRLAGDAAAHGGRVTCLFGNHELANLQGAFDYVHAGDMRRQGGPIGRARRLKQTRAFADWRIAHVENRTLFCHAGVHASVADRILTPADFATTDVAMLADHREYAPGSGAPSHGDVAAVRRMLTRLGCVSMVVGHNAVDAHTRAWDGLVTLADTMLSRAFGSNAPATVLCVRPDGRQETVTIPYRRDLLALRTVGTLDQLD